MKYFNALFALVFCCLNFNSIYAQNSAPEGIYYQAVARDDQGNEMTSTSLNLQISIKENATILFTENHFVTSDQFGLFDLVIGNGEAQTLESFEEITWEAEQYFLMVSLDSGSGYETLSETQLLSVPYSLYSTTALNVINDAVIDADADPSNELIEDFQIVADTLRLTEAGTTYSLALDDIFTDNDWILAPDSVIHNSDETNRVGINTASPSSTLDVDGSLALGLLTPDFNIVIEPTADESVILCNVTGGPVQVNLPNAEECEGRIYFIKKYANNSNNLAPNTLTIQPNTGQSIDLQPFRNLNSLGFEEMTIISDGANWFILARSGAQ